MSSTNHGPGPLAATWILLAGITAASLSAAPPPQNKTYFTILIGLEAPYSWTADCIRFTSSDMCAFGGYCGTWHRTEPAGPETAIAFEILNEGTGERLFDGQARIDSRGKKSTLSGVGRFKTDPTTFGFSFTGRATKRKKCARLVREWQGGTAATGGLPK